MSRERGGSKAAACSSASIGTHIRPDPRGRRSFIPIGDAVEQLFKQVSLASSQDGGPFQRDAQRRGRFAWSRIPKRDPFRSDEHCCGSGGSRRARSRSDGAGSLCPPDKARPRSAGNRLNQAGAIHLMPRQELQ